MTRPAVRSLLPLLCAAAVWAAAPSSAQNLVDLGVGKGHAINNSGQVALDQGIYSNGTVTSLPPLPGGSTPAAALAINASAQVAGSAALPAQPGTSNAILYSGGTLTNIGANFIDGGVGGGSAFSVATGINTSGLVVGHYLANSTDNTWISFTYANGTVTQINSPCSPTSTDDCNGVAVNMAQGINDAGDVVGTIVYNNNESPYLVDAYLLTNGTTWNDLGAGAAYAINTSGQVTGTLTSYTLIGVTPNIAGTTAFLYSSGVVNKLGTLPGGANSTGYALNSTGQVVGASDFTGSTATHAFFYNGAMTDLNSIVSPTDPLQPYVTLTDARGINDIRLIVANGVDSRTGLTHAYLLQGPWIDISPGSLSFGSVAPGGTSAPQTVTLTNANPKTLAFGSATASEGYTATSNCGPSLASGAQCTVTVSFAPTSSGALNGTLTIVAGGVSQAVALSGIGSISASLTASATALNVGQSLTLTWASSAGSTCVASSSTFSFQGSIPASGSKVLTESAPGTDNYGINCTAPGAPAATPTKQVVWSWPPVTTTLSASPTTITEGGSVTLTWSSTNASSCTTSGGGAGDDWAGVTRPTSGSQSLTEAFALATSSTTLTFTITCTSKSSGLSSSASVTVTENDPKSGSSGGGGAFDWASVLALLGMLGMSRRYRREARVVRQSPTVSVTLPRSR
jgi:probable HAF family extracellular repeat protein